MAFLTRLLKIADRIVMVILTPNKIREEQKTPMNVIRGDSDDELEIMAFMGRRGIRVDYEVKYELGKDMSEYCCWYILIRRKWKYFSKDYLIMNSYLI